MGTFDIVGADGKVKQRFGHLDGYLDSHYLRETTRRLSLNQSRSHVRAILAVGPG